MDLAFSRKVFYGGEEAPFVGGEVAEVAGVELHFGKVVGLKSRCSVVSDHFLDVWW